jgi:hypothetical protein
MLLDAVDCSLLLLLILMVLVLLTICELELMEWCELWLCLLDRGLTLEVLVMEYLTFPPVRI